jgi:hypothetical protein
MIKSFKGENLSPHQQKIYMIIKKKEKILLEEIIVILMMERLTIVNNISNSINHFLNFTNIV